MSPTRKCGPVNKAVNPNLKATSILYESNRGPAKQSGCACPCYHLIKDGSHAFVQPT